MWWKQNQRKVIVLTLLVAVLAAAFWYGGGAPGMQGWTAKEPGAEITVTPSTSETHPAGEPTVSPVQTVQTTDGAISDADFLTTDDKETQGALIDPGTGKDPYQTDPVPEGKPLPVEPQDMSVSEITHTCTLSISCATILDNLDWLDPEKTELVPEDGWILPPTQVTFYEGESAFHVLLRTCKQQKIHMEFENTPMYNSAYIEGIQNLYEFDCGELSGWVYKVNDWFPNYGCSRYALNDGDIVCWVYTCNLGADVGGSNLAGS